MTQQTTFMDDLAHGCDLHKCIGTLQFNMESREWHCVILTGRATPSQICSTEGQAWQVET
eukprot:2717367-Amphidinium_carterae.1